jgi:Ca-activated chloride channel family protein
MGLRLEAPIWLLLLIPALALTFIPYLASRRRMGAGRRRAALAVRTLLLSSLVLALAGIQFVLPVDRLATVFVVDLSDSVGNTGREDALAYLRQSLDVMPEGDQAGIVAFGKDALVERLPEELRQIDTLHSAPVKAATDIGAALRLAAALFPDAAQKRIVLLSDGNDTTGRGQREAALAAARGIQVETRAIGLVDSDEVLVERLRTPSTARLGEEIPVDAIIDSSVAQPATIRLFLNGQLAGTQQIDLKAGSNSVTFSCPADPKAACALRPTQAGFYRFRVVVEAARNTFSQNDRADSNTIVKGEPRTLVLQGDEKVAAELVTALKGQGQQVDTMVPEALPTDLGTLLTWDSIVVVDVPRLRFSDAQLAALQTFVRDIGRGVVMIGGPQAYGAGGYTKTPMEDLLPVEMGVRDRNKEPDIALVIVIDKSGSMDACHCNTFNGGMGGGGQLAGVKKDDIGKEAILRAAASLTARDEFGVVAFDEQAHWVINTKPLGQVGDVASQLGAITPNGQTNIYSGLEQAVDSLEKAEATRRHIILLTDGWSRSGQYDAIIQRMKAAGITLSTVGAGGGANPFLEQLATQGGGRFYAAANVASIPDIFLKETQQVAGQQIVEEKFFPIVTSSSPITRNIDAYPQLLGYNGTTVKSAAQLVLVSPRDDPLLAQWQYGLGRSVAWTSDSTGRWAKDWVGWKDFSRFFTQLVSWTFPGDETDGIEASFETVNGQTRLHVQSVEADGSPRDFYNTLASITGPDFSTAQVSLDQIAPGVYETNLGEIDSGAYAVRITQMRSGAAALGRTVGLVEPVAAEYRLLGINLPLLASLRGATGGKEVTLPEDPWIHDLKATSSFAELWPWLLVLALLLWPLDVALRRVSIGRRELADARGWVGRTLRARRSAAPRTATSEGMLAARERAGGGAARAALLRRTTEDLDAGRLAPGEPTVVAPVASPTAAPEIPLPAPAAAPPRAPSTPTSPPEPKDVEVDTLARLREAKRRARGG